jgi:RNA ligase (TIGR02306 family)
MAEFAVTVMPIREIVPIENADKIEAVKVGDFLSITLKGQFQVGNLVAYIPEGSLVPLPLLKEMGLEGKLAGSQKNRVKAIKLRGCLSQGLVLSYSKLIDYWVGAYGIDVHTPKEGENVAGVLGIIKYEPPMPAQFSGRIKPCGDASYTVNYDIENIKKYHDYFVDGEEVVMSEKIHGTLMEVGILSDGQVFVTSKGLAKRDFIIEDNESNDSNTYIRAYRKYLGQEVMENLQTLLQEQFPMPQVVVFGEVFGIGVQDLGYHQNETQFRAFDIYIGNKHKGSFLSVDAFIRCCDQLGIPRVEYLYRGPFSKEVLDNYTNGLESISGNSAHIREGVVVRPVQEREERGLGRVILKSVSEAYLLRKGEVTEYA